MSWEAVLRNLKSPKSLVLANLKEFASSGLGSLNCPIVNLQSLTGPCT